MLEHEQARARLHQDDPRLAARTVRDRMLGAGISEASLEQSLAEGRVLLAGEPVSDPDTPAPWPASIRFALPPAVEG